MKGTVAGPEWPLRALRLLGYQSELRGSASLSGAIALLLFAADICLCATLLFRESLGLNPDHMSAGPGLQ